MSEPYPAIRLVMMPEHANPVPTILPGMGPHPLYGTIFGGVILSYIDMAGSIAARREITLRGGHPTALFVTVAINRVEFKTPVLVGDVVSFNCSVARIGRTSITMKIDVMSERAAETLHVTDAEVVYVGIDPSSEGRRPVPLLPAT